MDPNPYESPQLPSEPPVSKSTGFWRDTLSLLLWGAILYVPTAIVCTVALMVVHQFFVLRPTVNPLIILLTGLSLFLVARIYWRFRARRKPDSN